MQKKDDSSDEDESQDTALDTDLPITAWLSPLRWGNISLLSLTTSEGYNSNPNFARAPLGSSVSSINGLVVDSQQFAGWQMNLQYRPFVWISSRQTFKSFAAASMGLRTLRRIDSTWHWTVSDQLRYAPTHATEQSEGFVANPTGGFSIGNAFLSSGRNVFANGVAATLTDRYRENSSIIFHANQSFTSLSSYIGGISADNNVPTQEAIAFSSGVTWRNHYSYNNTLTLGYNFRTQTSTAAQVAGVQSHNASVGWSHKFSPQFGISASGGPAWSIYGGQNARTNRPVRTTLHGSLAISREFRRGSAVLSFSRSDGFTGIISNSFHNRYEASLHREISSRLHWSASASYVQQQILDARSTNGALFSTEGRYFLSRNIAVFGQVRYLKISGNERIVAPETNGVIGIRWAWVPEKP
jgi:hypothetical protein